MNHPITPVACTPPRRAQTQVARHGAKLSVLMLGLFSTMMLAGAEGGGCVITIVPIDEEEECLDLAEVCPNLACELFATDDDGCPLCECDTPPPPEGCESDADCRANEYCSFDIGYPEPQPASDDANGGAGEAAPPAPNDDALWQPRGECRELVNCPPTQLPLCSDSEELVCYFDGQCDFCDCRPIEPPPVGCESDDQCPNGLVCEIYEVCSGCAYPDDPNGSNDAARPACDDVCERWGECVEPWQPNGCEGMLCGPGAVCEETPNGPTCVAIGESCFSDDDCHEGQHCELDYICPPCADGEPACLAPCFAEGRCIDDTIGNCDDGTEPLCDMIPPVCHDGQVLAVRNNCYECVDANTCEPPPPPLSCANVDCAPGFECIDGFNGPMCVPVSNGCYSDQDCADTQRCNASDVCMLPPECGDPNTDPACPAVCYGFCEDVQADGTNGQP